MNENTVYNLVEEYKKYECKVITAKVIAGPVTISSSLDLIGLINNFDAMDTENIYPIETQVSRIRPADPQEGAVRINSATMIVETWMNGGWRRVHEIVDGRARL